MSEDGAAATDTTDTSADTGTVDTAATATTNTDDWGADEWKALAKETGLKPSTIKQRLEHARTWEQRAKENKDKADAAKTLEEQVAELRKSLTDRDIKDVERAGRMAMTTLRSQLTEAGIRSADVADLLEDVDPVRLLKDGEPDDEAIAKRVTAFKKAAGRPTADPDQGKRGGKAPQSMGDVMRSLARKN